MKRYVPKSKRCPRTTKTKKEICSVLMNGPSLNGVLESLECNLNNDYLVVNMFAFSPFFQKIKPSKYVLADDAFWKETNLLFDEVAQRRQLLIDVIREVSWAMTIFIPYQGYKTGYLQNELASNHNISFKSFSMNVFSGFEGLRDFCYKKNIAMPLAQNVAVAALYLSLQAGYKKIRLYGADFSWTETLCVREDNIICQRDIHFYEDGEKVTLSPVLAVKGKPYRMHDYLHDLMNMFHSCWDIRLYADSIDAEIINMSTHSFIDAFKRKDS